MNESVIPPFFLCCIPTWTRVIAAATTIGILLLAAGCNFEHYNYALPSMDASSGAECGGDAGTNCVNRSLSTGGSSGTDCGGDAGTHCEPACTVSIDLDGGYPSSLVAHWSFDGDGGAWLESDKSDQGVRTLTLSPNAQDTEMRYSKSRINGKGNSIYLDGSQFAKYTGSIIDRLFKPSSPESGFTVSAWLSMESDWLDDAGAQSTRVMPIVSTMSSDSCGYQLDIRWNEGQADPSLVFSYGYRSGSDAGNACRISKLEYPLTLTASPVTWGMRSWHRIAGMYVKNGSDDSATLKLYWDGNRVANSEGQTAETAPPIVYTDYRLYLGTNGGNSQWFKGYLDEIAIFNRPLNDGELADFLTKSTTRPGPSRCRWYAGESWDKFAPDASTASWQSDSTIESSHIVVNDNNWGAGFLGAILSPAKDLRLYNNVYLDATLQKDKVVTFQIQNSDGYCQWLLLGTGVRYKYLIDLSKPAACSTTGCEFKLDKVESISIVSEWVNPLVSNPTSGNPARNPGPVDIIVHSVAFEPNANQTSDWSTYGGAIGPNGWCWRPISFDLMGGAEWASNPSVGSVSVNLAGLQQSSSRIEADFSDKLYHLPEKACVTIDASTNVPDEKLDFEISDIFGSATNWNIRITSSNTSSPCMLQLVLPTWSSTAHGYPYDNFPNSIDLNKIKSLGIQKPFDYDTFVKEPVKITVRDITINPDDNNYCTSYGTAASCL